MLGEIWCLRFWLTEIITFVYVDVISNFGHVKYEHSHMRKHTAGLRTRLHWMPWSSKITVTRNSILYSLSLWNWQTSPATLEHLKWNVSEEQCLTMQTQTTKSSPMKPRMNDRLSSVVFKLQSKCVFVWVGSSRGHFAGHHLHFKDLRVVVCLSESTHSWQSYQPMKIIWFYVCDQWRRLFLFLEKTSERLRSPD